VNSDAPVSINIHSSGERRAAMPPDALKQVLLNLVQNAKDATSGPVVLDLSVQASDGVVSIAVRDNGPGVPAEIRERIFDPFFTTRESAGGVGLGLFVVEGVVRAHGGRVWLDGDVTEGACFRIDIPIAAATDAAADAFAAPESGS
jgi:signal transduction histidine kinase